MAQLLQLLREVFGLEHFRPGQETVSRSISVGSSLPRASVIPSLEVRRNLGFFHGSVPFDRGMWVTSMWMLSLYHIFPEQAMAGTFATRLLRGQLGGLPGMK
jgi:hypothetical protein